jgi:hypothetical protein
MHVLPNLVFDSRSIAASQISEKKLSGKKGPSANKMTVA